MSIENYYIWDSAINKTLNFMDTLLEEDINCKLSSFVNNLSANSGELLTVKSYHKILMPKIYEEKLKPLCEKHFPGRVIFSYFAGETTFSIFTV